MSTTEVNGASLCLLSLLLDDAHLRGAVSLGVCKSLVCLLLPSITSAGPQNLANTMPAWSLTTSYIQQVSAFERNVCTQWVIKSHIPIATFNNS